MKMGFITSKCYKISRYKIRYEFGTIFFFFSDNLFFAIVFYILLRDNSIKSVTKSENEEGYENLNYKEAKILLGTRSNPDYVRCIKLKNGRLIYPPYKLWPKWEVCEKNENYISIESSIFHVSGTEITAYQCFGNARDSIHLTKENFLNSIELMLTGDQVDENLNNSRQ